MMPAGEVLLVSNGTVSDQTPLSGGVPVQGAFRSAEPHEGEPALTVAFGLSHAGFGVMAMLRSSESVHEARVSRAVTPPCPLDPAVIVTVSPVAVAGKPLAIVQVTTAPA